VKSRTESPWSNPPEPQSFMDAALITIESIRDDPFKAFASVPDWVRSMTIIAPPDWAKGIPDVASAVHVTFGQKLLSFRAYPDVVFALLCEITRLPGISIAANSDGKGRAYARIVIAAAPEDLTTVDRFVWGAGTYDQIKVNGIAVNASPENLRADTARRLGKDARAVVMGHAERIAKDIEERGAWPSHLTSAAYLANLRELLAAVDLLKQGIEVDVMPESGS